MIPGNYYHATPLHYVPHLLLTGALYSQRRLAELGLQIRPRPSAAKRDRKLQVDRYVHLSLTPVTPLLIDKRRRGYPHVLLEFGPEIADMPGAAYLKYNTKAWRHREDFVPISDPNEFPAFLEQWARGKYPSAEMLIPGELPLAEYCRRAIFASEAELGWVERATSLIQFKTLPVSFLFVGAFPPGSQSDLAAHNTYFSRCVAAGQILDPPDLPFD